MLNLNKKTVKELASFLNTSEHIEFLRGCAAARAEYGKKKSETMKGNQYACGEHYFTDESKARWSASLSRAMMGNTNGCGNTNSKGKQNSLKWTHRQDIILAKLHILYPDKSNAAPGMGGCQWKKKAHHDPLWNSLPSHLRSWTLQKSGNSNGNPAQSRVTYLKTGRIGNGKKSGLWYDRLWQDLVDEAQAELNMEKKTKSAAGQSKLFGIRR
jgi:hypothetical protein